MKIAVVTGGGGGLGSAIARGLADKGFAVLLTDIDEEAAAAAAEAIESLQEGEVRVSSLQELHW